MAVTPTFPSRESLRRLRFRPIDVTVGVGVLLLIYAVIRVGASARVPFHPGQSAATISSSPSELPYYAARSLLRMFIALFFSYAFSLGYAYVAARSRRAQRIMIPALDILQSVPVLGFLAITVTFFTGLFPGSELGLEAASIFAVFTAQAWNITFSFYHSLVSQSGEFNEASKLMGLSRWKRFWTLDVTVTTGLVDTYSTPTLLRLVASHQLDASQFVTHHFALNQFEEAYETFARAAETKALKVVLTRTS